MLSNELNNQLAMSRSETKLANRHKHVRSMRVAVIQYEPLMYRNESGNYTNGIECNLIETITDAKN